MSDTDASGRFKQVFPTLIAAVGRAGSKLYVDNWYGNQLVKNFVANEIVNAGMVINKLRIATIYYSAELIAISRKVEANVDQRGVSLEN